MTTSTVIGTLDTAQPFRVHTEGHNKHEDKHLEEVIAREVSAGNIAQSQDAKDLTKAVGDAKYDVTASVERTGIANLLGISDIRREVAHEVGGLGRRNDDQFASTRKDIADVAYETLGGFKDAQATAYQIEGRQVLEAEKNRNLLAVQSDKNTYQLQLQAQTNAAAAAAQLAECCCELKEKITAEAVATRDLINTVESNRLRDDLTACKAANTAYFTRGVPPVTPG